MPHLSNFLFFCDSGVLHWKQMTSADEPPPSALSPDKETKEKGKKLAEWCANHQFIGAPVTHFCPVLARPWAPRLVNHPECRSFYPWLKTEKTVSWRQMRPTAGAEWKVSFNLGFGYDLSGLIRAKHHSFHHGGGRCWCWYISTRARSERRGFGGRFAQARCFSSSERNLENRVRRHRAAAADTWPSKVSVHLYSAWNWTAADSLYHLFHFLHRNIHLSQVSLLELGLTSVI